MTSDDIAKARETIAAASKGPAAWTYDVNETEEQAIERFMFSYRGAKEVTGETAMHTVEVDRDEGGCMVLAITGNGPTSAANARYIVGSFDPVAGWAASLDEVERLSRVIESITNTLRSA